MNTVFDQVFGLIWPIIWKAGLIYLGVRAFMGLYNWWQSCKGAK